jgi:hypothetical protein
MSSHRFFALVAILGCASLMLFTTAQVRADITYQLVDYPLDQDGHTLSGTITTDGFIGELGVVGDRGYNYWSTAGGHITGGTFQIDNSAVYQLSYMPEGNTVVAANSSGQIVLYPTTDNNPWNYSFWFMHSEPYIGGWGLQWYNSDSVTTHYFGSLYSAADSSVINVWQTYNLPAGEGHIANNDPWVIAQIVPEPATLWLLVTALPGFAGFSFVRRQSPPVGQCNGKEPFRKSQTSETLVY